jgi:hypothetical protein
MTEHEHDTEQELTEDLGEATEAPRREAGEEEPGSPAGLGRNPDADDPDTEDALATPDDAGEGEISAF